MRFGLVVEYDGTEFHGSQLQSNSRTVQGELEHALQQIFSKQIRVHFASRTDSGVHARGQVGRFDEETDMSPDQPANGPFCAASSVARLCFRPECFHRAAMPRLVADHRFDGRRDRPAG